MTRNGLIAICCVCLLIGGAGRAHGLDPSKRLTQYRHSMWRVQDGFLPGNPIWVSQTADGYLWVGGHGVAPSALMESVLSRGRLRHQLRIEPTFSCLLRVGDFGSAMHNGVSHVRGDRIVSHFNLAAPLARHGGRRRWISLDDHVESSWLSVDHFVMPRIER